jgi:hypothetical protein
LTIEGTKESGGSPDTFMRGAFSKYCWNFKASKVADITTIFKSLRLCMIWTHERECEGKQNDLHSADCVMPVLRCDDCVELRCAVLYCAELCCSVLFSTMLSCTLLRCVFAVLYSTVLSCTMLCCVFVLLYSTLLYCAVLRFECCAVLYSTLLCDLPCGTYSAYLFQQPHQDISG